MKVMKFGGTSVGTTERMKGVVALIKREQQKSGNSEQGTTPVVVVLSAMSGTTNSLVEISNYLYKKNADGANEIINSLENKYLKHIDDLFSTDDTKNEMRKFIQENMDYLRSFTKDIFTSFEEKSIVAQGEQQWRFVIQTSGRLMGSFAKRSVPFELSNWTTFRFNGKKLIYAIDDSDWSASTVPVELDRSIPHLIRWQSIAYSPENRVHSFLLPPKPSLVSTREKDGSLTFSLEGEAGYTIGNYSNSSTKTLQIDNGTFSSITADVFPGDSISKTAP